MLIEQVPHACQAAQNIHQAAHPGTSVPLAPSKKLTGKVSKNRRLATIGLSPCLTSTLLEIIGFRKTNPLALFFCSTRKNRVLRALLWLVLPIATGGLQSNFGERTPKAMPPRPKWTLPQTKNNNHHNHPPPPTGSPGHRVGSFSGRSTR